MPTAHDRIITILQEAKDQQKPYPQTFELLKKAGVTEYTVCWKSGYDAVYTGSFGVVHEPAPTGFKPITIASDCNLDAGKEALRENQQKKINFVECLSKMGAAGFSHYHVDMSRRTVTYYSPLQDKHFIELVPPLNKIN